MNYTTRTRHSLALTSTDLLRILRHETGLPVPDICDLTVMAGRRTATLDDISAGSLIFSWVDHEEAPAFEPKTCTS